MTATADAPEIAEEDRLRADLYDFLGVLLAGPPSKALLKQAASLSGDAQIDQLSAANSKLMGGFVSDLKGMDDALANTKMLEVHNDGRSVVATVEREQAEFYVTRLHAYGLQATMEQVEEA